jgi:hypothetical protein
MIELGRVVFVIIVLHSVEGHEIDINPAEITSMRASKGEGEFFTPGVYCMVSLSDGKFVTVSETCEQVRDLIKREENPHD